MKKTLQLLPFVLLFGFFAGLIVPPTRALTLWMLQENHPVELLTFLFLIAGGGLAIQLAVTLIRQHRAHGSTAFFILVGFALLVIGMEEISWGQQFFGFDTPESMEAMNQQGEINLHNLEGIHGKTEWLRLFFGISGLIGIAIGRIKKLQLISISPLLLTWFLLISAHATADLMNDFIQTPTRIEYTMSETSELIELMIGIAAWLYLWLKRKEITGPSEPKSVG